MKRHDLPLAVAQHLVAALESLNDEAALRRRVAFPHDILVWRDVLDRDRQVQKRVLFLLGKLTRYPLPTAERDDAKEIQTFPSLIPDASLRRNPDASA
jgi:hypothetical protein